MLFLLKFWVLSDLSLFDLKECNSGCLWLSLYFPLYLFPFNFFFCHIELQNNLLKTVGSVGQVKLASSGSRPAPALIPITSMGQPQPAAVQSTNQAQASGVSSNQGHAVSISANQVQASEDANNQEPVEFAFHEASTNQVAASEPASSNQIPVTVTTSANEVPVLSLPEEIPANQEQAPPKAAVEGGTLDLSDIPSDAADMLGLALQSSGLQVNNVDEI